jgi:aminobenzoyl-glutamate utilization protein A
VNAGKVGGGAASNIVPDEAFIEGEVRGETTELMAYAFERAERVLDSAAEMHGCSVETDVLAEAPGAKSDDELRTLVRGAATAHPDVERVVGSDDLGGSEDATFLMRRVQERGGLAAFVGVGTDHPGGHHSATFDVDEETLDIGVAVLADAVRSVFEKRP